MGIQHSPRSLPLTMNFTWHILFEENVQKSTQASLNCAGVNCPPDVDPVLFDPCGNDAGGAVAII